MYLFYNIFFLFLVYHQFAVVEIFLFSRMKVVSGKKLHLIGTYLRMFWQKSQYVFFFNRQKNKKIGKTGNFTKIQIVFLCKS